MLKTLVVACSLMVIAGTAQAAETSFSCGHQSPFGGDAFKQFEAENAHNSMAARLLRHFTGIWELQEKKRICEAYERGEPAEFGCLIDRRDYSAILTMMPDNYRSLDKLKLNAWASERGLSLSNEKRKYMDTTHNACVKAGAFKGKLREVN